MEEAGTAKVVVFQKVKKLGRGARPGPKQYFVSVYPEDNGAINIWFERDKERWGFQIDRTALARLLNPILDRDELAVADPSKGVYDPTPRDGF